MRMDAQQNNQHHNQPEWVLIRGLIRSRFHWGAFPDQLLSQLQQQQLAPSALLLPELAGNGERFRDKTPFSIHNMMLDIRHQVQKLSPDDNRPRVLVAISMGAMIASEWARCYPQEVARLHLINTSFSNFSTPWQRMKIRPLLGFLRGLRSSDKLEAAILRWTLNMKDSECLLPLWCDYAAAHPLSLRNGLAQLLAASHFRGPKQAPLEETFFYNSLADRLVDAACTRRIAEHWQKNLLSHPRAGHDLPMDDPDWLIQKIIANEQKSRAHTGPAQPEPPANADTSL
ncbi:alpha/beta fold hydrolase [Thalassolituus hydrocarboniclasticus]|uniref:Alpha/beta fold hydrolase n=1 Tax=Thalassolituus hydrocarboniclasticus TaxID=2742796 RepID=A0ABY6AAZ6_9GAMM|nr:alpha/beta hydrolase [Thalassolituus hydrocarboniclasticus]UXD87398.1 alpha/beta fold hydrolase [Thalassolituus hydrocarboniclasticus]